MNSPLRITTADGTATGEYLYIVQLGGANRYMHGAQGN